VLYEKYEKQHFFSGKNPIPHIHASFGGSSSPPGDSHQEPINAHQKVCVA